MKRTNVGVKVQIETTYGDIIGVIEQELRNTYIIRDLQGHTKRVDYVDIIDIIVLK